MKRGCIPAALPLIDILLLQSKHYRHGILNTNGFTTLHTGFPLRHAHNHADSFFVQIRVNASQNFSIYDTTVLINHELYSYTALSSVFPVQ